jgi:inorganic pyrophosphatase/exopolyphosphatase
MVIYRLLKEFPTSIDAELACFLQAPILLDSYYFDPSLKDSKWTDIDLEIFEMLSNIQKFKDPTITRQRFDKLFNAITDLEMNL